MTLRLFRVLAAAVLLISPALFAQTIQNLNSHDKRFSPGALAQIFVDSPVLAPATVQVGGRPAAVISQNFNWVVIQIPVELAPGDTTVVVTAAGVNRASFNMTLDSYAPALYTADYYSSIGVFYRPALVPGGPAAVDCAHPTFTTQGVLGAPTGEILTVYATGLGATNPAVPTGATAPATPPAVTLAKPELTVGGRAAEVLTAVQAPGMVGVYRIDFRAPVGLGDSFHAVVLSIGGKSSNTVYLPVGSTFYNLSAAKVGGWPEVEEWIAAPESIMTARSCFSGSILSNAPLAGDPRNPPATLGGTAVKVIDSAGVERLVPLVYVAPYQVNYIIPSGTANGKATVKIISNDSPAVGSVVATATLDIRSVAPALFTKGGFTVIKQLLRVRNGVPTVEPADQGIDWGPDTDELYLVLFGTGFRFRSSLANVHLDLGGKELPVVYAGPQAEFPGLDQLNLRLPRSLRGSNPGYWVGFTVDGNQLFEDLEHGLKF